MLSTHLGHIHHHYAMAWRRVGAWSMRLPRCFPLSRIIAGSPRAGKQSDVNWRGQRTAGQPGRRQWVSSSGWAQHGASIAGGLHHAMRGNASGFCVYNDPAVAIAWLLRQGAERVAYVDLDVHHRTWAHLLAEAAGYPSL
jgi:hypothetical protein